MNRKLFTAASAAALLLVVAAGAWWLWPRPPAPPVDVAEAQVQARAGQVEPAPAPASAPLAVPEPASGAASAAAEAPLGSSDAEVKDALIALLGKPAVLRHLLTDGFAGRVVATVDNLPRAHAAPRLWPVLPTGGRFTVDKDQRIALDNAERYGPLLRLAEGLTPAGAAAFYRRLYPQLQAAYTQLGYPDRSFHARLVEVLDHLLATPQASGPLAVKLTEVKGPVASERPWVRYEFADPALEAMSAGQKILLRAGEVNQRRMMSWLRQFRAQVAR